MPCLECKVEYDYGRFWVENRSPLVDESYKQKTRLWECRKLEDSVSTRCRHSTTAMDLSWTSCDSIEKKFMIN